MPRLRTAHPETETSIEAGPENCAQAVDPPLRTAHHNVATVHSPSAPSRIHVRDGTPYS
ncbi:hypothetical protein ACT4S5_12955 [Kocuria oceani]|uniref:hypothetical protein n=1 Tax=Kocuria oceani TaxID=988827 RepID=UPI004035CEFD